MLTTSTPTTMKKRFVQCPISSRNPSKIDSIVDVVVLRLRPDGNRASECLTCRKTKPTRKKKKKRNKGVFRKEKQAAGKTRKKKEKKHLSIVRYVFRRFKATTNQSRRTQGSGGRFRCAWCTALSIERAESRAATTTEETMTMKPSPPSLSSPPTTTPKQQSSASPKALQPPSPPRPVPRHRGASSPISSSEREEKNQRRERVNRSV